MYLLYPDATNNFFDEESNLLEFYHSALIDGLMTCGRGGPSSYLLPTMLVEYELCRLDFFRHMLGIS